MELEGTNRRLPIYLVIDVSGSMSGGPIDAVNTGLREFEGALKADPHALETAYISVITFSDEAKQVSPLTEAGQFTAPRLSTATSTNLGAAIRLLGQSIDRDVQEKSDNHPGDWKPLIFLMTDGQPTDSTWSQDAATFSNRQKSRPANVVAIGCGGNIDQAVLKTITPMVLLMPDMSPEKFRSLFAWMSQSAKVASRSASQQAAAGQNAQLPPPPQGFNIAL